MSEVETEREIEDLRKEVTVVNAPGQVCSYEISEQLCPGTTAEAHDQRLVVIENGDAARGLRPELPLVGSDDIFQGGGPGHLQRGGYHPHACTLLTLPTGDE